MRIVVSGPAYADDTAYGYELRYLDLVKACLDEGVSLQDLKLAAHSINVALDIVRNEMAKEFQKACDQVEINMEYNRYLFDDVKRRNEK